MATTVGDLIKSLQTVDPNTPVVFQYLLPEHTDYTTKKFAKLSEALEYTSFADEMSREFTGWLEEMETV
jgi:hypothetical protein